MIYASTIILFCVFFFCAQMLVYCMWSSVHFLCQGGSWVYDLWIHGPESMCVPGLSGHAVCGGGWRSQDHWAPISQKYFLLGFKMCRIETKFYLFLKNSSQLEWLNMLIIVQMIHFYFVYVMPSLQKIRTKWGFVYLFLYIFAGSTKTVLHLSWRLTEGIWMMVLLIAGSHVQMTGPEKNGQAAPIFHASCIWRLMTLLQQIGSITQNRERCSVL